MSADQSQLKTENLSRRYGGVEALADVSFAIESGTTALVGLNGAGKTTLLRILSGALRPSSGRVHLGGHDPYRFADRKAALMSVALMPQHVSFPANMTAVEVVCLLGWLRGMSHRDARHRAMTVLDQVDLSRRAHQQVKQLSGGMVRRLALAQALVSSPRLLLLDEPSTGLDPEQRRIMVRLVQSLDATVLFSSHIVEDVEDVADRVLVLEGGRLLFDGGLSALEEEGRNSRGGGSSRRSSVEEGFLHVVSRQRGVESA